nr:MAG TPA: hypothetical protein [Caudoviricetes sp.]
MLLICLDSIALPSGDLSGSIPLSYISFIRSCVEPIIFLLYQSTSFCIGL